MRSERESMVFDVVIVGAGPSGLSCAIHLKQLAAEQGCEVSVCVLEKGASLGAHILSGACFEPRALDELFPDWQARGAPVKTPIHEESFVYLSSTSAIKLPMHPQMHNSGNYVISLGNLCRWLGEQAEALGVEIYPGFAASEVLYHNDGSVSGVATGDMGLDRGGEPTANYQQGVNLYARQTIFAEGCKGSLTQDLFKKFYLRKNAQPQTYGIGIKEIWEVTPAQHRPGKVLHTIGWPLGNDVFGGSFLYHLENNQVVVGFVVGLDYKNPWLSPFEEFQRFKTHPSIKGVFSGARRVAFGARALAEGGVQSLPKLSFPGGVLIGDTAGFLNVAKIKGSHTAMKSGMLAAEAVFEWFNLDKIVETREAVTYSQRFAESWLFKELHEVRNVRPGFKWGLWAGLALAAVDAYLLKGKAPWTLGHREDHATLIDSSQVKEIKYPKPDGALTFDRLSSVFLSDTNHKENQPCHIRLKNSAVPISVNFTRFAALETRYCPAEVYEVLVDEKGTLRLQINAQNCLHCKTCEIKDPTQNIKWVVPEGGGGPNYSNM